MREILFRGKTEDGKWVEGVFIPDCLESMKNQQVDGGFIKRYWLTGDHDKVQTETVEVVRETVGQFTGLLDKNGKKIFEGDIVEIYWHNKKTMKAVVKFNERLRGFWCYRSDIPTYSLGSWASAELEVIGNIHDNPELMEV